MMNPFFLNSCFANCFSVPADPGCRFRDFMSFVSAQRGTAAMEIVLRIQ
jgi:hypothetical protein